jgi:hypothetical protein
LIEFFKFKTLSDLLRKIHEYKRLIRKDDEWASSFMFSDVSPLKIMLPSELRDFIFKWRTSLNQHWMNQVNWWLKCDERSLLAQNIQVSDSRRKVVEKLREPIGKFYDEKFRSMLRVYNSLSDKLRRNKVEAAYYEDLITVEKLYF